MNRTQILSILATHTGEVVEKTLSPGTSGESLARSLEALGQLCETLAAAARGPEVNPAKLSAIQSELERRVGIVTEEGPIQTMPLLVQKALPANHAQS